MLKGIKPEGHQNYVQCKTCIMDTTDPDITFNDEGVCNHCLEYPLNEKKHVLKGDAGRQKIEEITTFIKQNTKGKKYDCLLGISGGVDSTYLAYLVKEKMGLNPLVVHFDNGWNSEIAVKNVNNLVTKLNLDLFTYVINWEDFKDLQLAYLKASVLDIDVPTDHLIFASLFKVAKKNKIKYVISGNNVVTESLLPKAWTFKNKFDLRNLNAIHQKYGTKKIKNFPTFGKWQRLYYNRFFKIKFFHILNYVEYNKDHVMDFIQNELGWEYYGGKHFESIFTRFYQGYILPEKFGIDKRKAHLSNLICSGQLTKEEALKELNNNTYTEELQNQDKLYFIKKFGLSLEEFEEIMNRPIQRHEDFPMEQSVYQDYPILKILKPLGKLIK